MNDFFLNSDRVKELWQKVKAYVGKYGDGLSKDKDTLKVNNPVRGVYTQKEFDALSEEEKASGTYFVDDGSSDGGSSDEGPTEIYSTEETRIGTWIDGKPLYRITYKFTLPETTGTHRLIDVTDLNIDLLVDIFGVVKQSNGSGRWPLNSFDSSGNNVGCWIGSGNLIAFANKNTYAVNQSGYVTLKYTKTTDPEVSA